MNNQTINQILEIFYVLIGLQFFYTAWRVFRNNLNEKRIGTSLFWVILGLMFIVGPYIPNMINGILVLTMGVLTITKNVRIGKIVDVKHEEEEAGASKFGSKLFIPAIVLAVVAVVVSTWTPLGGAVGIGVSSVVGLIVAYILLRPKGKMGLYDSDRLVQQIGTVGILPQFLAALGILFTVSGLGETISKGISGFLPEGNQLIGAMAYVIGMVLFTMLMGNAFAAFTVITASIGVPFVMAIGGDPAIAGALAMTGGFCGTLLTPMAANFNTLPIALLEMKDELAVIKAQIPMALILIVVHIVLMYLLAF
ncbi:DUF979 domain-containing protein [Mammaliicoccus stepanovicii]|uniref:Membrane protein n=1 Tax=Mammaliicoccus stepanovicii TaxID=643214 RepID=A0A239Y570_9STAP|nr:DUF979 domain-containing protein [Mammaliicoccus stepanovicii]PNZ78976.1 DUF979 domain-containing protein [Mammaliicoccus stepanovicii]GGI43371.1 hypothetical protein GCM10010896_23090 [Mammaliicoccus stepanovicii]SNV54381.1 Membrane protein [Mammaliicoccus stepanovicii]